MGKGKGVNIPKRRTVCVVVKIDFCLFMKFAFNKTNPEYQPHSLSTLSASLKPKAHILKVSNVFPHTVTASFSQLFSYDGFSLY